MVLAFLLKKIIVSNKIECSELTSAAHLRITVIRVFVTNLAPWWQTEKYFNSDTDGLR